MNHDILDYTYKNNLILYNEKIVSEVYDMLTIDMDVALQKISFCRDVNRVFLITDDCFAHFIKNIEVLQESPILLYVRQIQEEHPYFIPYFIWKASLNDLDFIDKVNKQICQSQYRSSHTTKNINQQVEKIRTAYEKFIQDGSLIALDAIITIAVDGRHKTLFELTAMSCLSRNIDSGRPPEGSLWSTEFRGFKFGNGHYQIGEINHLDDFYYDKLLIQDDYFLERFAIILARHIRRKYEGKPVTVIGYQKYTEELVNRIVTYLYNPSQRAYNIIDKKDRDEEKESGTGYKFLRNDSQSPASSNPTNPSILLLPVVVSARTADRLKSHIKYEEILTVLKMQGVDTEELPETFCTSILNLEVEIYKSETCGLCFPAIPTNEKLLLRVDRSRTTPQGTNFASVSVRTQPMDSTFATREISHECHYHGHIEVNGGDYWHYIDPVKFLQAHKTEVIKWLTEKHERINEQQKFKKKPLKDQRIILIIPEGSINSQFGYLVNEFVFSLKAKIILHDTNNDYSTNFRKFYEPVIKEADLIYFVDDGINGGNTFGSANVFLKQTNWSNKKGPSGFAGIFVMINRADDSILQELQRKLGSGEKDNIYSFAMPTVPNISPNHIRCPLCEEKKISDNLAKSANTDTLSLFFKKNSEKLKKKKYKEISTFASKDEGFLRFLITDLIYTDGEILKITTDQDKKYPLEKLVQIIEQTLSKEIRTILQDDRLALKAAILKVLCSPPLVNYDIVRKTALRWILTEVDAHLGKSGATDYLKSLFKRLAILKSNYLINLKTLEQLKNVWCLDQNNPEHDTPGHAKASDLMEYEIAAAVKILLNDDPNRCIKLEENLAANDIKKYYESTATDYYPHLLRILSMENTEVLIRSTRYLLKLPQAPQINLKETPKYLYTMRSGPKSGEKISLTLGEILDRENNETDTSDTTGLLPRFLQKENKQWAGEGINPFSAYMRLLFFLREHDEDNAQYTPPVKLSLEKKMETIFKLIYEILGIAEGSVSYLAHLPDGETSLKKPYIYDYPAQSGLRDNIESLNVQETFLAKMMQGIYVSDDPEHNYLHTFTEFIKIGNDWEALKPKMYTKAKEPGNTKTRPKLSKQDAARHFVSINKVKSDINHFFFLQLTEREKLLEDPDAQEGAQKESIPTLAVLAIATNQGKYIHPARLRYLLLAREKLCNFIRHHYRNDSFKNYLELDRLRRSINHDSHTELDIADKAVDRLSQAMLLQPHQEVTKNKLIREQKLAIQQTIIKNFIMRAIPSLKYSTAAEKENLLKKLHLPIDKFTAADVKNILVVQSATIFTDNSVLNHSFDTSTEVKLDTSNINPKFHIEINRKILTCIINEVLLNIKKRYIKLRERGGSRNIYEVIKVESTNDSLIISNNFLVDMDAKTTYPLPANKDTYLVDCPIKSGGSLEQIAIIVNSLYQQDIKAEIHTTDRHNFYEFKLCLNFNAK